MPGKRNRLEDTTGKGENEVAVAVERPRHQP